MNLAQSFRVTNRPGGCFATKIDLYFSQTDATLPVTCLLYTSDAADE